MNKNYFATGANYYDHHKDITINVNGANPADIIRAALAEDVTPDSSSSVSSETHSGNTRGPKTQILFADEYGNEDLERTRQEAERITKYIADHRLGHMRLDSKRTNKLNLLVACFWYRWDERDWVAPNPQGAAIYRFITEQCHIPCDVQQRAFTSTICALINERKKDPEIYANLCTYFPK